MYAVCMYVCTYTYLLPLGQLWYSTHAKISLLSLSRIRNTIMFNKEIIV